jgi:hypothetical protein
VRVYQYCENSVKYIVYCKEAERRVQDLVGKPDGKGLLARPRRRREDNIKMDLQEVGCGCMDWIELAQDRAVSNAVMNHRVT